jgi:hypothetical protein
MAFKYEGFPAGADTTKVQGAAAQLLVVTKRAKDKLGKVPNAVAETALYTRWFGAVDGARLKTVQRIVSDIDDAAKSTQRTITFVDARQTTSIGRTEPGTRAYVHCGGTGWKGHVGGGIRVLITQRFFTPDANPDKVTERTVCVMFHELSHKLGGTVDYVYGRDDALELARNSPANAHKCAENYGLFALEVLKP